MCYSKDFSLFTLIGGILTSYLLNNFGDKNYSLTNNKLSIFYSFVSLMQLTEYLIWSDINCNNGLNKLAGYIGPLLNNLQPSLIYLLYYDELKKNNVVSTVNIVYIFYNLYKYINFINNKNICSGLLNNHISWSWSYNSFNFYFIIMILNFYYLKKDDYVKISIILSIISYIVSYKYFKTNLGEFWCLFVVLIPIIILLIQRINIIRKKYYQ